MRVDEQGRIIMAYTDIVSAVMSRDAYYKVLDREGIQRVQRACRCRNAEVYFESFSSKRQAQIIATIGDPRVTLGLIAAPKLSNRVSFQDMDLKQRQRCMAMYGLVMAMRRHAEQYGDALKITTAKKEFVEQYNQGAMCPEYYPTIGTLGFSTIERWNKELRDNDDKIEAFAPVRRDSQNEALTQEQQQTLIYMYCRNTKPTKATAYRNACRTWAIEGVEAINMPSPTVCRRFLTEWERTHQVAARLHRDGEKAVRDTILPSLERDPEKIQYMDCLVADGKVLNFQIINPNTGKLCRPTLIAWMDFRTLQILGFELMVTENTLSVASAFRHACINAGRIAGVDGALMPRMIYMDNGKAFKNKALNGENTKSKSFVARCFKSGVNLQTQIGGLFSQLKAYGLEHVVYARPYNARTKIIERAWQSFDEMEQMANTYVGDRLENKPAALMRNEVWHRENRAKDIAKNGYPTLWGAYQAVEWWVGQYNNMVGSGKYLDGTSPNALAAAQITQIETHTRTLISTELDYMMLHSKTLKLRPNGFKINGESYYNPIFADRVGNGDEYIVRFDPLHPEKILVFHADGRLWCEATPFFGAHLHPAAILGSEADRSKVRNAQKTLAAFERSTFADAKALVAGEAMLLNPALPVFNTPMEIEGQSTPAITEYDPDDPRNPNFPLFKRQISIAK